MTDRPTRAYWVEELRHVRYLARWDNHIWAAKVAEWLAELLTLRDERDAARAALAAVRAEMTEHGDLNGWYYGDCWQDCLDLIETVLAPFPESQP